MAVTFGLWGLPDDVYDISSGATLLDGYARSIDLLGPEFTTLWASDHFQFGDAPVFECWTRMCFLAARFERFHVGSIVLGQGYRNPALLAKMAATFHGEHYSITDAYCLPVPPTPIPIMIGTAGRRVVRIAAEHADGWNSDSSPDVFDPPHAHLVERLHELGRSPDEIAISVSAQVNFPEDVATFVGVVPTEFPDYDFDQIIHGPTPQDAIASLGRFVDRGVTHFQIAAQDLRTLRLFATEVAPALASQHHGEAEHPATGRLRDTRSCAPPSPPTRIASTHASPRLPPAPS